MSSAAPDSAVERYLEQVRASLRGMPEAEIDEILLELRGQIAERSGPGGDVEAILRTLGNPAELGREYRTDSVASRAECGGSPIAILHSLLLLRRGRFTGTVALALTALGYAWAIALGAASFEKTLSSRRRSLVPARRIVAAAHHDRWTRTRGNPRVARMVVRPARGRGVRHLAFSDQTVRLVVDSSFPWGTKGVIRMARACKSR